ncbi:fibronectin type III/BRCA1 domain-containing protein [Rhizoctonia solani AG-1 IA]|uniref:Fibronectin type III/BRCA1 domain-containing protein n=1 Tax=Thanatephorus cucumeris (strain AG1-IA) TaxID=983506 RepID=L8X9D5_THACA|nr:fibronectin type III/BRCA1 domain-containing protein [Rhizoctonia solani AG-1 IA]
MISFSNFEPLSPGAYARSPKAATRGGDLQVPNLPRGIITVTSRPQLSVGINSRFRTMLVWLADREAEPRKSFPICKQQSVGVDVIARTPCPGMGITVGIFLLVLEAVWSTLRRLAVNSTTATHEIARLGKHHPLGRVHGNAVVAGGRMYSMAGLATAVVCSKFFERVIVIEPDSMNEHKRTRVAQAEQIHGLQAVALQVLRGIIPGFDSRLYKHGGRVLESNGQLQLGPTNISFKPGSLPDTLFISRLSLEKLLREYVRSIPTIEIVQGSVTRITPDVTRQRIECVTVQAKGCSSETLEFDAAMFADCTGPATIGLRLLEKTQNAGWGPYPKTSYGERSYATALIPVPGRLKDILPIFTRHLDEYSTFSKLGYVKSIVPHPEQDDRIVCMVLMCGVGGWNLSLEARPRSFGDYIQQVDSIWQNASDGKSAEGDASRIAVMDTLRAIEVALGEDGIIPEFKYCKMGVNPTFGQGISKALVDVATLNGVILDTTLVPSSSTGMPGWGLPATFSNEMFARQIPRVMHMWDSTKGSVSICPRVSTSKGSKCRSPIRTMEEGVPSLSKARLPILGNLEGTIGGDKNAAADIIRSLQLIAPPLDLLRLRTIKISNLIYHERVWVVPVPDIDRRARDYGKQADSPVVYEETNRTPMMNNAANEESFTFTVGKLDAGMAILIGERAHLIEFPSLLLPPGVTSGSIVNISVNRNVAEEKRQQKEFWELQDSILETFGQVARRKVRNVTQTSVTLEWPLIKLATAKLRSLDIYRNGQRLATIPSPTTNTSTKLSGLDVNTEYTFQLVLRTTAGTYPSNVIRLRTHTITDTSGISVCFGTVQDTVMLEQAKLVLREMRAKWSDKIQIDTTHFVCTTPAAAPSSGQATGGPSVEYQKALQMSIPVVQPHWILACHAEKNIRMVPISGYYLGATPSTPMNAPPFTRTGSQVPQGRDSLTSPKTTSPSTTTGGPDHVPSPETRARQNDAGDSVDDEMPQVPTIKVESHDDKLGDEELERARQAPVGSEPRSRSGTMKSDFKFPPPTPPPVPQIIVGDHDDDQSREPKAEREVKEEQPPVPSKERENTDDDVGEMVEVGLN